jgi:hypothetical protein
MLVSFLFIGKVGNIDGGCQVPVHEASAQGVKDFPEKQDLKKQSFIPFPKEERG